MKVSILIVFSFLLLIGAYSQFVLAEEGGVGGVLPSDINIPPEPTPQIYEYPQGLRAGEIWFYSLSFISLIIGIALTIFMVKASSKIVNLIVHGLLSLVLGMVLIWGIGISILNSITSYPQIDDLLFGSSFAIPLFVMSLYFSINLVKKKDFNEIKKYSLNLSSGMLITTLLVFGSMSFSGLIDPSSFEGIAGGLLAATILIGGAILSFVLGIVGLFIDYKRN